jgi:transcriptional antiterminator NusG
MPRKEAGILQHDMQEEEKDSTLQAGAETIAEGANVAAEPPRNPNMKWYIIHSYSGFERKVKESLESRIRRSGCRKELARC